jgi:hypothetical protein
MNDRIFGLFLLAVGLVFGIVAGHLDERSAHAASNDAVSVGSGIRFICQTSAPSPVGRARLWVRCSDGQLVYTAANNLETTITMGDEVGDSLDRLARVTRPAR